MNKKITEKLKKLMEDYYPEFKYYINTINWSNGDYQIQCIHNEVEENKRYVFTYQYSTPNEIVFRIINITNIEEGMFTMHQAFKIK